MKKILLRSGAPKRTKDGIVWANAGETLSVGADGVGEIDAELAESYVADGRADITDDEPDQDDGASSETAPAKSKAK